MSIYHGYCRFCSGTKFQLLPYHCKRWGCAERGLMCVRCIYVKWDMPPPQCDWAWCQQRDYLNDVLVRDIKNYLKFFVAERKIIKDF